jgi:hypothetical protein
MVRMLLFLILVGSRFIFSNFRNMSLFRICSRNAFNLKQLIYISIFENLESFLITFF